MRHNNRLLATLILTGVLVAPDRASAQRPAPVIDYASALDALDVYHRDGTLRLDHDETLVGAFLPPNARVDVVIAKSGSDRALHVARRRVARGYGVFSEIVRPPNAPEFRFTEPGEYTATFRVNGRPVTIVPFAVMFKDNGDAFDPQRFAYLTGPWRDQGFLLMPLDKSKPAEFRTWGRVVSFVEGRDAVKFMAEIRKDGDVIANCGHQFTSTQEWQKFRFQLRFPKDKGGEYMRSDQLLARGDGTYHVVVRKNDQLYGVWAFEVTGGKPVPHPRQASDYQPRSEYVLPRYASLYDGGDSAGDITWMKRLSDPEAIAVYEGRPAAVAGPDASTRTGWLGQPSGEADRPFRLVVTDVEARSDTPIRAGDDLVVFGSGHPNGVRYLRVGETEPREIPSGETFSSTVFQVCGRKIILVKRHAVYVFDTETEQLTPIPEHEISLYDQRGGLHTSNLLNADGNLVVVANDVSRVTDRTSVKVIDVSGSAPRVIPIKNGGYVDRDITSVAVNAKQGIVAVSSDYQQSLYVAKVARLANQKQFRLNEYRAVNDDQIFITDGAILYADRDDKLRLLPLDRGTPVALTDEPMGPSSNSFFHHNGRVAIATREHYGSRYHFALSDLPKKPEVVPGTGTKIQGTSGGLGMAGVAAILADGTVFLAGTDSIGVGEHLQVLDARNSTWRPVINESGKVVTASDVVSSPRMIAFKSADRDGRMTIGYATFGGTIDVSQIPVAGRTQAVSGNGMKQAGASKPVSSYDSNRQLDLDYLAGYVASEKQMGDAFVTAFGETRGRKEARQAVLDVMKDNDHSHLIPAFLKLVGELQ